MRKTILAFTVIIILGIFGIYLLVHTNKEPEIVMLPNMQIIATTKIGTIKIIAEGKFKRKYIWNKCSRSVVLWRRQTRWNGSLGIYFPGPGSHWTDCDDINRCVVNEGRLNFTNKTEAINWIKSQIWINYVYNNNGLVVGWLKSPSRGQLNVDVWQILINGEVPKKLEGANDNKISISFIE